MPQANNIIVPPRAAIYVRLSQEDRYKINKEDESESIINQQNMLLDFCKEHQLDVYDIYNDEDFKGSDRERPEFNRMIEDARDRKFSFILCKTQSRFARDVELVEKYINTLFPILGIRFIGVVDNTDSDNKANRKQRQIISLVDQWYLEDLSDNIRATLSSKRKMGLWVGAFAPYGYIKDPNDKNHLIVDKEAAEVVEYIFELYLKGYGITRIARMLNEQGIPNPATYKQQHNQPFQSSHGKCSDLWHTYSIQRILSNEVYIGNTVQGMQENISYKSNKKRIKPREEWDIVENTHEAIISDDVWNKVQELRKRKCRSGKSGSPNVLARKVRCLACGGSMRVCYNKHMRYFRCNTCYIDPTKCKGMNISEKVLHRNIIQQVNHLFDQLVDDEIVSEGLDIANGNKKELDMLNHSIETITEKLAKTNERLKQIYLDKLDGEISKEEYNTLRQNFIDEKTALETNLSDAEEKRTFLLNDIEKTQDKLEFIKSHKHIEELDAVTVNTLIEKVEIGGSRNDRIINIYWRL